MHACLLGNSNQVNLATVPEPVVKRGEVLVRFKAGGICGTDLEKIQGGYGPGGILGHEVSGIVEAVGQGVKKIQAGDSVVPHHHVPCYVCRLCQSGDFTMCEFFKTTNFGPCGFADRFLVPETNVSRGAVIALSKELSFEEGALLEPTACCIRALRMARTLPNESVLVVGLGPTGLTQLQILRLMKLSSIIGSDTIKVRREMGRRLGASLVLDPTEQDVPSEVNQYHPGGVDLAVVATGNPRALSQAILSVRKGGRVLLFGAPARGASLDLDVSSLFARQLSILTSYSCVESDIQEASRLASTRAIDLPSLVTHRFSLENSVEALQFALNSKDAVKTMITT